MSTADAAALILAVPSKGRLMDQAATFFRDRGLDLAKSGNGRGYRGAIAGLAAVEVAFLASSEIAQLLRTGEVHMGVIGEDVLRETIPDADQRIEFIRGLGFGRADVVVAVPQFWIDVADMFGLDEAAVLFRRRHGRHMRVATKYMSLTRRFFAGDRIGNAARPTFAAVNSYRIVESLGATEGAPASGAAELIVDITTTGATLAANGLKVLDDGLILRSQAQLVAAKAAAWSSAAHEAREEIIARLG